MQLHSSNETWIIAAGDQVIQKTAHCGLDRLSTWERLVYCLWAADYGMRNAGDLKTARDIYPPVLLDACRVSEELSLPLTRSAFSMVEHELEEAYFDRFDAICDEIRRAEPSK